MVLNYNIIMAEQQGSPDAGRMDDSNSNSPHSDTIELSESLKRQNIRGVCYKIKLIITLVN